MSDTQKESIKKWATILFLAVLTISIWVGIANGQKWAIAIVVIAFVAMVVFIFASWICYFINEQRIMGVLTPKEYEIYKGYRVFSGHTHSGIYANKCNDPTVKRIYLKAATAKRVTFFDD